MSNCASPPPGYKAGGEVKWPGDTGEEEEGEFWERAQTFNWISSWGVCKHSLSHLTEICWEEKITQQWIIELQCDDLSESDQIFYQLWKTLHIESSAGQHLILLVWCLVSAAEIKCQTIEFFGSLLELISMHLIWFFYAPTLFMFMVDLININRPEVNFVKSISKDYSGQYICRRRRGEVCVWSD